MILTGSQYGKQFTFDKMSSMNKSSTCFMVFQSANRLNNYSRGHKDDKIACQWPYYSVKQSILTFCRSGYYEALKKFTLKKFLLLILFLDKAKLTRLIDHDPCLFNKDAGFKVFIYTLSFLAFQIVKQASKLLSVWDIWYVHIHPSFVTRTIQHSTECCQKMLMGRNSSLH